MGHRDLPCALHAPYVDALHDLLHDEPPEVDTREAVREISDVLISGGKAYGYERDALVESFLNMPERQLADLLYGLLDAENRIGILKLFSANLREKARRIANDEVRV